MMMERRSMRAGAKLVKVAVKLPGIEGEWIADRAQQIAAWEMYVELITRVAVQPLGDDEGLQREVLASLYALFGETRRILREHGPGIAIPEKKCTLSFGAIAVDVLNVWLRPFLARWHPRLDDGGPDDAVDGERGKGRARDSPELRAALRELQRRLAGYADLLAEVSRIPSLHARPEPAP
jgi:hypothetical protein